MKLTQEQIEEIRRRVETTTPGRWESFPIDGAPEYVVLGENKGEMVAEVVYEKTDAEFIANARQDIPALLAHIAELESESRYWRNESSHWQKQAEDYREKGKRLFEERNMWKGLRLEAGGRLGEVIPKLAELETIAKDYAKLSRLFLRVTDEYLKSDKYDSEVKNFAQYINDCVADGNPVLGGVYDAES